MNYRHAFHAGNFADVFKHIVLVRILVHLRQKTAPFRLIDTHAGAGLHDLASEEATRTGEWRDGIDRLTTAAEATGIDAPLAPPVAELVAPYLAACRAEPGLPRYYPGSPLIALRMMRPQDRLVACEIEPNAVADLACRLQGSAPRPLPSAIRHAACSSPTTISNRQAMRSDDASSARAKVLAVDGWTALTACVPPKERRGLVLIDPPYERPDESANLARRVMAAHRKWSTGIYMMWYPIKSRTEPDELLRALRPVKAENRLRAEITIGGSRLQSGLGACGVIVLNPPWKLASELNIILPTLIEVLGRGDERRYVIDHFDGETEYRSLQKSHSQRRAWRGRPR